LLIIKQKEREKPDRKVYDWHGIRQHGNPGTKLEYRGISDDAVWADDP